MANSLNKTQRPRIDKRKRLIRDQLMTEISEAIPVMMEKRDEATYRQLAMSIESFIDTVQMLDGLPKGIQNIAPALNEIMDMLQKVGWDRVKFFDDMRDELRLELARKRLSETQRSNTASTPYSDVGANQLDSRRPPQADRAAQSSSAAGDAP